jgi:hypothetical protein
MKKILLSYFDGGIKNTTKSYRITLEKLYSGITTCQAWRQQVQHVRTMYQTYGKRAKGEPYEKAKAQLSYFMPSGVWSDRTTTGKLITPSNLIQIDVDNLVPENMSTVKNALINDKHTLLLFLSPSGAGFKGLARHEPDKCPSRASLEGFYKELGINIDSAALFSKQPCYVSFDDSAYMNLDAEPFIFEEDNQQTPKKHGGGVVFYSESSANSSAPHVQSYCRKIINQSADYVKFAPAGDGCASLNRAAYKCGMYAAAGLNKADAATALWQAFDERQTGHTEHEFLRIFDCGFEAGCGEPKTIKDRPPVQRK